MSKKSIVVALAGNPNSGKTTVFNSLTGARQHVGNWPGVTVEKKEGKCTFEGYDINIVDLPGVYSLNAFSPDEVVARDFIVDAKPDVVVNVVDATNLERNLYLSVQLMEMEVSFILALNMMDEVEEKGYRIDIKRLSKEMGVPVVPMIANRSKGIDELLDRIVIMANDTAPVRNIGIQYGREVEKQISRLEKVLSSSPLAGRYSSRWMAVKLIEGDEGMMRKFAEVSNG